jgi:CheY-like chemotaxis protein
MSDPALRILIADADGDFRRDLVHSLEQEEQKVDVTDDSEALVAALTSQQAPELIVLGSRLKGLSGLDALYYARTLGQARVRKVLLVTDVRKDLELLDFHRSRGILDFLHPQDPIERLAARIQERLYEERRIERRTPTELAGMVRTRAEAVRGRVENLSPGGAQVALPLRRIREPPALDETVILSLESGGAPLALTAVVRRTSTRRRLLRDQLVLGLRFEITEADRTAITAVLDEVEQRREITHSHMKVPGPW